MSIFRCVVPFVALVGLSIPEIAVARPASGAGAVSIEGSPLQAVGSIDYPGVIADAIEEESGATYYVKKHIGTPKYGEVTLTVGVDAPKAVYEWVAASWAMNYQRKNGKISTGESVHEFFNALVTETTLPAVDATSTGKVGVQVKFAPEYTRIGKGEAAQASAKLWSANAFRFSLGNMDMSKVERVDKLVVKQVAITDDIGDVRDYGLEPGKLNFPNITFYLPSSDARPLREWHKSFVVDGNNSEDQERNGSLEYLSADGSRAVVKVDFFNAGILSVRDVVVDKRRLVRVEIYVERMQFSAPALQVKGKKLGKPVISPRKPIPGIPGGLPPKGGLGSGAPGKKKGKGKAGRKSV